MVAKSKAKPAAGPSAGPFAGRRQAADNAIVHIGWGRLLFAPTFTDRRRLAMELCGERPDERDIAVYVEDPHIILSVAPQSLFLDPSDMMRLRLDLYRQGKRPPRGFVIRRLQNEEDIAAVQRIYAQHGMIQPPADFLLRRRGARVLVHLVAVNQQGGEVIGTVTGVDHLAAYNDPDNGASLWCLAVDHRAPYPGVGEALVRALAEQFIARGRARLDLSVMHDNRGAIALYRRLGFRKVKVFTIKHKSAYNEALFISPPPEARLNPYAQIITDEARRRGIGVEIEDAAAGLFKLSHGGRTVACRESLSDLTTAVAMSRTTDKSLTLRLVAAGGLRVPEQIDAAAGEATLRAFLKRHKRLVVKPAHGEQGRGVRVGLTTWRALHGAIRAARRYADTVLVEQYCPGQDLRVVVIGNDVVAAALRRPPAVTGNGRHTIEKLIEVQSRRRAASTGGESRIPIDSETRACLADQGYRLSDVVAAGRTIQVRRTANLHTGGTLHDVTGELHPATRRAALDIARLLEIPVVGLDFIVATAARPGAVFIEANERPGLANHEPQPTAERFIDLLFPHTAKDSPPLCP